MLTSFSAYASDIASPLEQSALPPPPSMHHHRLNHPPRMPRGVAPSPFSCIGAGVRAGVERAKHELTLSRVWWERANLNGWGYGRSMLNEHRQPTNQRCVQARTTRVVSEGDGESLTSNPKCRLLRR